MGAPLLAVLVASVLLAALARRYDVSAPLGLVVAGLAVGLIPGVPAIEMQPQLVMFVVLPPLLWSAGLESSYLALRKNVRPIGLLAVGLPLATTLVVGFVAFHTVPELTVAAALTLGAIVAPPDAVSAAAIGRRLGLPRQIMTLLGGESLLNDATALTAYKVALAAAVGAAATWQGALGTFALAAAGGVVIGGLIGWLIEFIRTWLDDPLVESAIGLVAPYFIYWLAEEAHGSGVIAVVVAALLLGQRATRASYATRLQDDAVWKSIQLVLESFAFLMIGLQLPTVVDELTGIRAVTLVVASAAVLATVIGVRIVWVYVMAYTPRMLFRGVREREPTPTPSQVFIVAWAGMRGVVSLAAARRRRPTGSTNCWPAVAIPAPSSTWARCCRAGTTGAATRCGSGWAVATRTSARARRRPCAGCGWRCWPPSARRTSPNAMPGTSTTRCCGRCSTGWTWKKRRSTGSRARLPRRECGKWPTSRRIHGHIAHCRGDPAP